MMFHRALGLSFATVLLLHPQADAQLSGLTANGHQQKRPLAPPVQQPDVLDFEAPAAGSLVSALYGAGGTGPVYVRAFNPGLGAANNAALVLDSQTAAGAPALGTPNRDFGGAGIDLEAGDGLGGEAGSPFENSASQRHVLVVAADLLDADGDGLLDAPADGDVPGSFLSFDFSETGGATLRELTVLDLEAHEPVGEVAFYALDGELLGAPLTLPQTGSNGLAVLDLGDVAGVYTMVVSLHGTAAIDNVVFEATACDGHIGNKVWLDLDCDGLQDEGEPGIPGVHITLLNRFGQFVTSTDTDEHGQYGFDGLCASRYSVCVDESTLPRGVTPTACNQGGDDGIDSECSCHTTLLDPGEQDRTIDFGYCPPPPAGGEGCTPGYWKQSQHFDSWPAPYTPDTLFSAVFEDAFPGKTLVQVAGLGGGGLNALGRHTVAALLNGASGDVDYDFTDGDVIAAFNGVFPSADSDDYEDLKDVFAGLNEQGCPLN